MTTPTDAPLLQTDRLGCVRAGRTVLNDISLAFRAGQWTAIVGPNGAGKSTLVALLAGLLPATTGVVRLGARAIAEWPVRERARLLTWLGQTTSTEGDIAASEIARLGRLPHYGLLGTPTAADEAAVTAALHETEAFAFAHRRLNELSGGERQRVLLARAFAADAPILLLDEPTIHLDAPHQRRLIGSLRERARRGAVLSVLHDLTLALAADRLVVLAHGKVRADGSPSEQWVRDVLTAVFNQAFTIERLERDGRSCWAAIPNL
ncbi:MAG TPA: ABC transporter ATP-binding protein [Steroidobacteraceae bacterium]|nr:ABC transporter ATP-binding protein [Steroidobacteraceae bacterium]